jgi:hypothetical protein
VLPKDATVIDTVLEDVRANLLGGLALRLLASFPRPV